MAPKNSPSRRQQNQENRDLAYPLLLEKTKPARGPIDDRDRETARRIMVVTETRKALATVFPAEQITDEVWKLCRLRRQWAKGLLSGENVARK